MAAYNPETTQRTFYGVKGGRDGSRIYISLQDVRNVNIFVHARNKFY
jgi:hypothetical protein